MGSLSDSGYEYAIGWIYLHYENGCSWDEIRTLCVDENQVEEELARKQEDEYWPAFTPTEWFNIVEEERLNPKVPVVIESGGFSESGPIGSLPIPKSESNWQAYKTRLMKAGFSQKSILEIENSSAWILNQLSTDTRQSGPRKGLVYGSVQSGKTANMGGVMTMAADYGWNVFIILSGTIESLRRQTLDRFRSDLPDSVGALWEVLDFSNEHKNYRVDELELDGLNEHKFIHRYATVCLKQKGRLERLITWLYSNEQRTTRMRIIVIDDEADQASINTADILDAEELDAYEQDRKAINRLIVNLVNGKLADGSKPSKSFQSVNYISFTATPYANVLNELPGESLYPKDFIYSLSDPEEYFGCKVVFGNDEKDGCPGLDVVRRVPLLEEEYVKRIHDGTCLEPPAQYKSAVAWFLCAAAIMRLRKSMKPASMLIHTSSIASNQFAEYKVLRQWLENHSDEAFDLCRTIYSREIQRFSFDDFHGAFTNYGRLNQMPKQYPAFEEIKPFVLELLGTTTNIKFDDDHFTYSTGIHICVDNYKSSGYSDDKSVELRIVYPDKDNTPCPAPAFIVLGGNTLSRGLTIEGLLCSYFTRSVGQADTLMQMARWFGYRRDCELLQRIWLTESAHEKYRALTQIDMELKEEVLRYKKEGLRPSDLGPAIRTAPNIKRFQLSSKRKMQQANEIEFDYSGRSYELTQYEDNDCLANNLLLTEQFLKEIGMASPSSAIKNAMVWRDVDNIDVERFIKAFSISDQANIKNDIPLLFEWITGMQEKGSGYQTWNIAVAGSFKKGHTPWMLGSQMLPTIERTKHTDSSIIDIGSLRSGTDVLSDVDKTKLEHTQLVMLEAAIRDRTNLIERRTQFGLADTPLLLIYRIEKNGGKESLHRVSPSTSSDIIGFSIVVSGKKLSGSKATRVRINL